MSQPLRLSLGGNFVSTPQQHSIPISGGDENQSNDTLNRQAPCSPKRNTEPSFPEKQEVYVERPDKRIRPILEESEEDFSSTTEVSVSVRREWLREFGMNHENKFPSKAPASDATEPLPTTYKHQIRSPPKAPRGNVTSSTESMATTLVDRVMTTTKTKIEPHRGFAPSSFKARVNKGEVQATNEGYASVAKLSEWLANDPTSTKKKKHVRRGKNVISKSRNFEQEQENVIVIETSIPRGGVQDKKKMIQGAFGSPGSKYRRASNIRDLAPRHAVSEAGVSTISVAEKKDWLKKAFKHAVEKDEEPTEPEPSGIIVNDAASSLSVSDKKDWLQNAFKVGKAASAVPPSSTTSKRFGYGKAMTDIMHNRDADDDAKARIKARFVARSGRTPVKTEAAPATTVHQEAVDDQGTKLQAGDEVTPEAKTQEEVVVLREEEKEERTGPPKSSASEMRLSTSSEEEENPFDFRSARMAVISRGKQNGQRIQVVNKIYTRMNKFERMNEAERKHRAGAHHQLHSVSWEGADPSKGLPSHAYDKKMVPNIAPKKSFEELP